MARIKLVKLDIPYTHRETNQLNHTVQDAIMAASVRVNNRPVCTNSIYRRSRDEKITIVELNDIADRLVDDTHYWG